QAKGVLGCEGVIASPTETKFIDGGRTQRVCPSDRRRLTLHEEPSVRRGSGPINNAAKNTRDITEAIRIGIANKEAVLGVRLPVHAPGKAIRIVLNPRVADKIADIAEGPATGGICQRRQAKNLNRQRIQTDSWNSVVNKGAVRIKGPRRFRTAVPDAIVYFRVAGGGKIANPLVRRWHVA